MVRPQGIFSCMYCKFLRDAGIIDPIKASRGHWRPPPTASNHCRLTNSHPSTPLPWSPSSFRPCAVEVTTARADLVFQAVVKPKGMMSFKSQMDLTQAPRHRHHCAAATATPRQSAL